MSYFQDQGIWLDKLILRIIWALWVVYMLWLFAKTFGYINTPFWLENLPMYLSGISIIGFIIMVGRYLEKFNMLLANVQANTVEINSINVKLAKLETRTTRMESDMSKMNSKMTSMENRMSGIEERMAAVETRVTAIEASI